MKKPFVGAWKSVFFANQITHSDVESKSFAKKCCATLTYAHMHLKKVDPSQNDCVHENTFCFAIAQ